MNNCQREKHGRSRCRALTVVVLGVYGTLARPLIRRWGATHEEVAASYPGEELIPDAQLGAIMATTIDAPPAAVWPWLLQIGCDRAGFYSWDRLDNGGHPSAERIHPEWQDLEEGSRVVCVPDGSAWFDVALLESERTLVLRASLAFPRGRRFDPGGRLPRGFIDSTWGFHLIPIGDRATRLVVRGVQRGQPRSLTLLADWLIWEPAHWIMQMRQLAGLRRRAEATFLAEPSCRR